MKTKLALTLTSSALIAGGNANAGEAQPATASAPLNKLQAVQAARLAAMNKAEVGKLLARIDKAKAPEPQMGAMCYRMAAPPERMEYVCPVCSEKTLYPRDVSWKWTYELDSCRRVFKELPKRDTMTLDESSFCKKCQPGTKTPSLRMLIRFDDGTTNVVSGITSQDLRLLRDFLGGKLTVQDAQDSQTPLKTHLPRLRELLGVKDAGTTPSR